jgi:hypothetical protein
VDGKGPQSVPGGVAAGIRMRQRCGRFEVGTAGYDPNLQLVGGDPWGAPAFTGLYVPAASTASITPVGKNPWNYRYLFQLARVQFNNGESVRLVGLRQYADLVGTGGEDEATVPVYLPITSPLFRFPDGNISWHVMRLNKTWRNKRGPGNAPGVVYMDTSSPAMLFQTLGPYVPPNGGRPWGSPLVSDLANVHDFRFPWRDSQSERSLNIPIEGPCDVAVFVSVGQHETDGGELDLTDEQASVAPPEEAFWSQFTDVRYGRVAASLIFEEGME